MGNGETACPVAEAAKLLGDRWTLVLLRDLAGGPLRFSALQQSAAGISPAVLSARLKELEEHHIATRTSYAETPPRVEYALTERGRDALPVIAALRTYGEKWLLPSERAAR